MIGGAKGIGIGIDFGIPNQYCRATSKPYIEKDVLDSLRVVSSAYGKSNNDADRSIVKNLVDPDNPFVISNAAFKLNSGFGKYEVDFTNWVSETGTKLTSDKITNSNPTKNWVAYKKAGTEFQEMNVNISGIPDNGVLYFQRTAADGNPIRMFNGNNNTPAFTSTGISGFFINNLTGLDWSKLTIEQIPSYQGAFVTDGVDDLITSTKTVQEMGVTDEITVVSMIHQIQLNPSSSITNDIRVSSNNTSGSNGRIAVSAKNKTGIYGWSRKGDTKVIITKILGDKNDYSLAGENSTNYNNKFSVVGTVDNRYNSSVAWYWTVIANKVLTTDQINQVIAYYNLDRCVEPTVYYNVKKQGLTNDTLAADWYLKDFSKNGFDMSLFNSAKKGGSGVAAKQGETIKDYSIVKDEEYQELTIYNEFKYKIESKLSNRYWTVQYINRSDTSYPITIVTDKDAFWINSVTYYDADNNKQSIRKVLAVPANTPTNVLCCGYDQFDIPEDATSIVSAVSYIDYNAAGEITVEFIPSCKGGLITDGVNDYGKVTGLPIYKDYTVVTDREIFANTGSISSKNNLGAFVETAGNSVYSFGQSTSGLNFISTRSISYLSKYSYCGQSITAGAAEDGTDMWLGTIRDNDSRFFNGAIYSLMTFPYSLSEFLIERQLKKRKLGTLYPGMVEFRPIISGRTDLIKGIKWYSNSWSKRIYPGDYITKGVDVTANILLNDNTSKLVKATYGNNYTEVRKQANWSETNNEWDLIIHNIGKSPQKISIVISSYLTMLGNETLISNETLIKNE